MCPAKEASPKPSAILRKSDYSTALKEFGNRYPNRGYGLAFSQWLTSRSSAPYGSWGNGSAMRVSPVGFAFTTADEVLAETGFAKSKH